MWEGQSHILSLSIKTRLLHADSGGEVKKLEVPVAPALATLGGTTTGANESLEAQVEYKAKRGWKKTKALIDSEADVNLIS